MSSSDERLCKILKEYSELPVFKEGEILSVNSRNFVGDYPISIAAIRGIVEEVEVLLKHGADVNVHGEHGYTPLHEAVEQGHVEVVKLLLKHGASLTAKNEDGETPIKLAALIKNEEIFNLLNELKR